MTEESGELEIESWLVDIEEGNKERNKLEKASTCVCFEQAAATATAAAAAAQLVGRRSRGPESLWCFAVGAITSVGVEGECRRDVTSAIKKTVRSEFDLWDLGFFANWSPDECGCSLNVCCLTHCVHILVLYLVAPQPPHQHTPPASPQLPPKKQMQLLLAAATKCSNHHRLSHSMHLLQSTSTSFRGATLWPAQRVTSSCSVFQLGARVGSFAGLFPL